MASAHDLPHSTPAPRHSRYRAVIPRIKPAPGFSSPQTARPYRPNRHNTPTIHITCGKLTISASASQPFQHPALCLPSGWHPALSSPSRRRFPLTSEPCRCGYPICLIQLRSSLSLAALRKRKTRRSGACCCYGVLFSHFWRGHIRIGRDGASGQSGWRDMFWSVPGVHGVHEALMYESCYKPF